jgi:hypothetical protein
MAKSKTIHAVEKHQAPLEAPSGVYGLSACGIAQYKTRAGVLEAIEARRQGTETCKRCSKVLSTRRLDELAFAARGLLREAGLEFDPSSTPSVSVSARDRVVSVRWTAPEEGQR